MGQADRRPGPPADQRGIALLTGILLLMVMTVIGIASITLTGLESRLAGYVRAGEAAAVAAESCLAVSVNTIEGTIRDSKVPDDMLDSATPSGPVPALNAATLLNEVLGVMGYETFSDTVDAAYPNFNVGVPAPATTLNNFVVRGDIDRLHLKPCSGCANLTRSGYEGLGAGPGGSDILYQVSCQATNAATNARSKITAVYACKHLPDGCQRKV